MRLIIAGAVVVVMIIVYTAMVLWRLQIEPETKPAPKPEPPPLMAYAQGGEFTMGSDIGDEYERPEHRVTVKPFFIDLYEVTCEEYQKFVRATGHPPPPNWPSGQYPKGAARWPVTGVTWNDAEAYAMWAGKRLPTEAEWEYAARGSDGRRYPWGNEWNPVAANADANSQQSMVDVGKYVAGKSPFGAFDMVGNAWEWTASDFTVYPGGQVQKMPKGGVKIIRGGSWKENRNNGATTTYRGYLPAQGGKDYGNTGFRCVKDFQASAASQ